MKGKDMSIHVTDFKWEKGKNDLRYIELLEKTLKNEQAITTKAVAKIRELSKENKEIRAKAIDEFAERMSLEISESIIWDILATMNKNGSLSDTSDKIVDYVIDTSNKIAEQMKGGGKDA